MLRVELLVWVGQVRLVRLHQSPVRINVPDLPRPTLCVWEEHLPAMLWMYYLLVGPTISGTEQACLIC
jgi:hypothetical protein